MLIIVATNKIKATLAKRFDKILTGRRALSTVWVIDSQQRDIIVVGPNGNTCQKLWLCRLLHMEMSKSRHCVLYATPTITGVTRAPIFITIREHSFAINLRRFADIRRPQFAITCCSPERFITLLVVNQHSYSPHVLSNAEHYNFFFKHEKYYFNNYVIFLSFCGYGTMLYIIFEQKMVIFVQDEWSDRKFNACTFRPFAFQKSAVSSQRQLPLFPYSHLPRR